MEEKKNDQVKGKRKRDQFMKERNWQSSQSCFLIAVLNLYGVIQLERPFKLKTKSLPFIKVRSITIDDTTYNVKEMTNERVNKLIEEDKMNDVTEATIRRRNEVYRITEHIHVLIDLLKHTRFTYETIDDKHDLIPDKRMLQSVDIDGMHYTMDDIKTIGLHIHQSLRQRMESATLVDTVEIVRGDTELMGLLLKSYLH